MRISGSGLIFVLHVLFFQSILLSSDKDQAGIDFFEEKIRPALIKHCYECHAADSKQVRGGLLLDTRDGIRKGGDSGAAVSPNDPHNSLLMDAIRYESYEMPPKEKLSDEVIADFEKWIQMGAPDPRDGKSQTKAVSVDLEKGREFWCFQKPVRPAIPEVNNSNWPETEIDRFFYSGYQKNKLTPAEDASRRDLIRRATYALIGLPPTPEEIEEFLNDPQSDQDAFSKVVDRLLESPHFGERWGRHWLDVARFAESSGGGRSLMYRDAWRYRDYVINSFNEDKPVNQFIMEQIAGDLLPHETPDQRADQLIATGFLVMGATNYEHQDKQQLRMDVIDEQLNAIGRSFLGMTLSCARCHDHKFDPIPTTDYYAMAGILGNTQMLTPGNVSGYVVRDLPMSEPVKSQVEDIKKQIEQLDADLKVQQANYKKYKSGPEANKDKKNEAAQNGEKIRKKRGRLEKELYKIKPVAMSVKEVEEPADGHLHIRGAPRNLGPEVPRGFLSVVFNSQNHSNQIPDNQSGRMELGQWITSNENPLTARVFVNRVWRQLFGVGIVPTPDNFGITGEVPTHPELLDYLAVDFMENHWSTKELIRKIMLSRVYRLSSESNSENLKKDRENRSLWRANRRRLEAEAIRDSILSISGQLDLTAGGYTIRDFARYDHGYEYKTNRRSVYVPVFRSALLDFFELFDFANPNLVTGNRNTSTLPTQTLYLMNSPFMVEQARFTAERLISEEKDEQARIQLAYERILGRPPTEDEVKSVTEFLKQFPADDENIDNETEAWTSFCHSLLSCLDFLYVK